MRGFIYENVMKSKIAQHYDWDRKIIHNKEEIIRLWRQRTTTSSRADTAALIAIAMLSDEGRQLYRQIRESDYEELQANSPNSISARIWRRHVERQIRKGIDPFEFNEQSYNKGLTVLMLLSGLFLLLYLYIMFTGGFQD